MNKKRLQKVIDNFNALEKDEQKKIISYVDRVWIKVYDEYAEMCNSDPELCDAYDRLEKAKEAMSFDWADHYTRYLYTENEFDPEMSNDVYEYDPEAQEEAKHIYEHLDEVNAPLEAKLTDLNTQLAAMQAELEDLQKNGGLLKRIKIAAQKAKIAKLEDQIIDVSTDIKRNTLKAEYYGKCLKQYEEKLKYEQNYETLVAPYKKLYEERTKINAEKVVSKYLETEPVLVCKVHSSRIYKSGERHFSNEALNEACNSVRYNVLFAIRNKGEERV